MANSIRSSLLPLYLLFLVAAEGRPMLQPHFDNVINSKNSTTAILDSTSSSTTNANDVEGLTTLIKRFPALTGDEFPALNNDPCYPAKLSWIACSNDDVRRVTALFLGAQNLYGYLPDFSSMDALQIIDLHRNSLCGSIPEFLGTFSELTYLDLSSNLFEGAVPVSLANNKKINLNLAGNSLQLAPPATILLPPPLPTLEPLIPPPSGGAGNSPDLPDIKRGKKIDLLRLAKFVIPTSSVTMMVGMLTSYAISRYCRRRRARENHDSVEVKSMTTATTSAESTPAWYPTPTPKSPPPKSPTAPKSPRAKRSANCNCSN